MNVNSPIAKSFNNFLRKLQEDDKNFNPDITFQIYYDLFRIREAQLEYKKKVRRGKDSSLADIFQDIIAHYLRLTLPKEYSVILDKKYGKLTPDILIMKNKSNWAIIEIKTTIGWNRGLVKKDEYLKRLIELSKFFNIPLKRIFYIFEASRNVSKEFERIFRNKSKDTRKKYIYPLFEKSASPSKKEVNKCSVKEIFEYYKRDKITDYSKIFKKIIN
jgi:hypothetical protein